MRRTTWALGLVVACLVVACLVAGAPARAERLPGAAPPRTADPAWQLYDQAFERLAAGELDAARELLVRLRQALPQHPAAVAAAARLNELDRVAAPGVVPVAGPAADGPVEEPSQRSRVELALVATMHGFVMARHLCTALSCRSDLGRGATYMLAGGAGLGLSLTLTRGGLTAGQAQAVYSGLNWGLWHGLAIHDRWAVNTRQLITQSVAPIVGLGMGLGVSRAWRPTSGQVALVNSVGIWSGLLAVYAHHAMVSVYDFGQPLTTYTIAADLGLLAGVWLARRMPGISRGRTLIIDAGGILGFVSAGLASIARDSSTGEMPSLMLLVGTSAGLGLATLATRGWDAPAPTNLRLGLMPVGTRGLGASLSLDLD